MQQITPGSAKNATIRSHNPPKWHPSLASLANVPRLALAIRPNIQKNSLNPRLSKT
jgi:hypothetical protein